MGHLTQAFGYFHCRQDAIETNTLKSEVLNPNLASPFTNVLNPFRQSYTYGVSAIAFNCKGDDRESIKAWLAIFEEILRELDCTSACLQFESEMHSAVSRISYVTVDGKTHKYWDTLSDAART